MMFTAAKSGNSFSLIDAGEYEAYVSKAGVYKTKAGSDFVSYEFTIRNDVEQKFKNRKISKPYFKDFETGDYRKNKDGEYWFCVDAVTLGIEPGANFDTEELVGSSCIIVIGHYTDKNTGEKRETVNAIRASRVNPLMSSISSHKSADDELEEDDDDFDGDPPF